MWKKWLLIPLVIGLILTAGCWNRRELTQLGIVLGTGFDLGKDKQVEVTVQIAKPGEMQAQGGGSKRGGGGQGNPALVLSSQGKTAFEAVRNFLAIASRKLFWSHNEVFIFGEVLAKEGIGPVLDFLERNPELRREAAVLAAKGKAKDILALRGDLEKVSAVEISQALRPAQFLSKALKVDFHRFLLTYANKTASSVMPAIEVIHEAGKPRFRISGMAVFKKDKLTGWLNETETRGMLWVIGKVKGGMLVIKAPDQGKGEISLEIKQAKSKIKPEFKGEKPVFTVEINEKGSIAEETGPFDITDPEIIKQITKLQEETIAGEIKAALHKAQKELKADIFGFSEELHRTHPRKWTKLKDRWEAEFPNLEVKVVVKTVVPMMGNKVKPTVPQ